LTRLSRGLESNGFSGQIVTWDCSGGILSWFVQDEQQKSRSPSRILHRGAQRDCTVGCGCRQA
jgi:hypothetical protein